MKITFLVPGYIWGPSGGVRVVYEYANRLAARGHVVTVVHPRRLKYAPPPESVTVSRWVQDQLKKGLANLRGKPTVNWQPINDKVQLLYVPTSASQYMPDGDILFATGWHTVQSVLECRPEKGEKCYIIQGYESYHAPKDLVDATWRAPLHKVVIAKWLVRLGIELGCEQLTYIPNAINHNLYRLTQPIVGRRRQISMLCSTAKIKGAADGIEALDLVRRQYPDVKVVLFGVSRRQSWFPKWAEYHQDPPQDFLIKEIYNKSCLFVAPSWTEGSPLPPAEAAACGCAIVATNIGGFQEYIENGVTGLLSPPRDPLSLAHSVCRLLDDDSLRVRLAESCNRLVSRLDWERSTDLMEDFVNSVTDCAKLSS